MPTRTSAALLAYRFRAGRVGDPPALEVFLAHMGGPFWAHRDEGAWTIPKGEYGAQEEPLEAARREFTEEIGVPPPTGPVVGLGAFRQPSGKVITVFAVAAQELQFKGSNHFELEWPRGSGRVRSFPEVDRAQWFDLGLAAHKLVAGQVPILSALLAGLTPEPPQAGDENG